MIHGCKGDFGMICDVCGDSLDAPDGRVLGFKTKREMNSALWRMRNKPLEGHEGESFLG